MEVLHIYGGKSKWNNLQLLWFNDKKLGNYSLQISLVTYEPSFKYKEVSKCVIGSKTRNEVTFRTKK